MSFLNHATINHKTVLGLLLMMVTGCATMKELPTPDQATAIEQLLITQAVEQSLNNNDATDLPLPEHATVKLETVGLTVEQRFLIGAIGRWLGEQGLRLPPGGEAATYRIQILVQSLGTEQSQSFFGMPPVQGGLLPFAIPELSLFKAQYQSGLTRFRLDIFETTTGQFIRSTPWLQASTFYNEYTLLFFIDFYRTNLVGPFEEVLPLNKAQGNSAKDSP
jgi:hypothetical protein